MTWELTENVALECCFATTFLFVGSLYVWTHEKRHDRDEPETIKKRLFSVFIACILSTILIRYYWNGSNLEFLEELGIFPKYFTSLSGLLKLIKAILIPLFLTMIWFAGSLYMIYLENGWKQLFKVNSLIWWRSFIIAPAAEEWAFRSSMSPLLRSVGYGTLSNCLTTSAFFGLAHLHHVISASILQRASWKVIAARSLLQVVYTSIFGMYSAFLFLRTGQFIPAFITHWFCNAMGFPPVEDILEDPKRNLIIGIYVVGLSSFLLLLFPMTEPSLYL